MKTFTVIIFLFGDPHPLFDFPTLAECEEMRDTIAADVDVVYLNNPFGVALESGTVTRRSDVTVGCDQ